MNLTVLPSNLMVGDQVVGMDDSDVFLVEEIGVVRGSPAGPVQQIATDRGTLDLPVETQVCINRQETEDES